MSSTVGEIDLGLNINQRSFNRQLQNLGSGAESSVMSAFSGLGKKIGIMLGGAAMAAFGKSCLEAGSALGEVQNVVDVTFGSMSDSINQFAKDAMLNYGLSETAAKQYTSTLGAMMKSMGIGTEQAAKMSQVTAGLAADMASFYNLDTDEAFNKIRSGISGETEPLKQLGINMSVATMEAYALSKGIQKSYDKMSQQEQVLLRYNYLLSVTKDAQGDFARTENSWANQTRILEQRFEALKASLGQSFIVVLTPVLQVLNKLMEKLMSVANYFNAFVKLAAGIEDSTSSAATSTQAEAEAMDNLGDSTEEAARKAKRALAAFDEVNTLNITGDNPTGNIGDKLDPIGDLDIAKVPEADKANDDLDKVKDKLDDILSKLQPIKDLAFDMGEAFKEGILAPISQIDFDSILSGLSRIKVTLGDIISDQELQASARTSAVAWNNTFGKYIGNTVRVGANIATGLINGVAEGLEAKKQVITDRLTDTFNNFTRIAIPLGNIFDIVGDVSEVFKSDNVKGIWSDITQMLIDTCTTGISLGSKIGADVIEGAETILTDNQGRIYDAFDNTFGVVSPVFETLKDTVSNTCETILKVYDEKVGPSIKRFSETLSDFGGCIMDVYNDWVVPYLSDIASMFDDCFANHLQPLIDDAIGLMGQFAESVTKVLQHWEPLFEFLAKTIIPFLAGEFRNAMGFVIDIINIIIDVIKDIINALQGVLMFLEGVFTGDWDKAWEGIKLTFSSLWKGIEDIAVGVFKTISNWLDRVNQSTQDFIDALLTAIGLKEEKNAQNDLDTWVSTQKQNGNDKVYAKWSDGKREQYIARVEEQGLMPEGAADWIRDLPHYAKGGIIGSPQLAVLGEGGKKEAVVPLENSGFIQALATEIANAVVAAQSNSGGGNNQGSAAPVVMEIDGRELAKAIVPYIPEAATRMGVDLNG